jgi:hypothetical protein
LANAVFNADYLRKHPVLRDSFRNRIVWLAATFEMSKKEPGSGAGGG